MLHDILIFGDSYSTHKDFIPEEYPFFYCDGGRSPMQPVTDMRSEQTWWGRFLQVTGANLVHNNSWSGSTICYTGYDGDCSTSSSFIYRYNKLLSDGWFEDNIIDTIFVFGATNDSWANAPLGTEQYFGWKKEDLYSVLPAICYFMNRLKQNHPDVRIVFIANCDIKQEIIDCIVHAGDRFGVDVLQIHDIDKEDGHPTVLGMQQIYEQLTEFLGT